MENLYSAKVRRKRTVNARRN